MVEAAFLVLDFTAANDLFLDLLTGLFKWMRIWMNMNFHWTEKPIFLMRLKKLFIIESFKSESRYTISALGEYPFWIVLSMNK